MAAHLSGTPTSSFKISYKTFSLRAKGKMLAGKQEPAYSNSQLVVNKVLSSTVTLPLGSLTPSGGSACPCSYITFNTKDSCDLKRCWDSRHQTARLSILQQWTPAGYPRIPFTSDPACLELLEMPFALDCIDDVSNILAIKWSSQNTLEFLIYSSVHITQESTEWHMRLYKICYRGLIKWFRGQSAHCSRMNSVWIPSTHGKAWSRGSQV